MRFRGVPDKSARSRHPEVALGSPQQSENAVALASGEFCFAIQSASAILPPLMIAKLKQILLQQYIGAIVTAWIAAQGILSLVGVIFSPIALILEKVLGLTRRSVLGFSEPPPSFNWLALVPGLVEALLDIFVAYLLIRWLFWSEEDVHAESNRESPESEQAHEIED